MSDMQQEAVAVLAELWALSPDVRLAQLMAHLGFLGEVHVGKGLAIPCGGGPPVPGGVWSVAC
jgi:hypothetical protein